MSSSAKAVNYEPQDQPSLAAPLGEVPVAGPGFRRSMFLLVLLSVPLWAAIAGLAYGVTRILA